VHVLSSPTDEEQLPEAQDFKLTVGQTVVGHGMLHPGIVTMMKKPEIHEPTKTIKAENQCMVGKMALFAERKRREKRTRERS